MDGVMCEDIRIGIMVRLRLAEMQRAAEAKWDAEHPNEWPWSNWRRKDGSGVPYGGVSSSVIEEAGGIDRFFAEWELFVSSGGKRG